MSTERKKSEHPPTPYLDALVALRELRKPTRLMVPGHKGGLGISPELAKAFGGDCAEKILGLDIPLHVYGIDVHRPGSDHDRPLRTPIEQARELAAAAWGARTTHFVVAGGSQANHIVCLALPVLAQGRRPRVAVQRNVHQSVLYGLILAEAEILWLLPETDSKFQLQHGISPGALDELLADSGDQRLDAVMIVSPTYYGAVSDVQGLAEVVRARCGPETLLVVDEAWGAHFAFNEQFPTSAVRCGADVVISSTHKILGSLTQSAMLHVTREIEQRSEALAETVERAINKARNLVKTTSPSALLVASLDAARAYADWEGGELLGRAAANADRVRAAAGALPGMIALESDWAKGHESVIDFDPLRVTLDVHDTGLSGREIRARLWKPGEGGVEIEFCTDELIVLLFGMGDAAPDSADSVIVALQNLNHAKPRPREDLFGRISREGPRTCKTLREGFLGLGDPGGTQTRALAESERWICAEIVAPYPPGIAVIMPGELITAEIIEYLRSIIERYNPEFADCRDPKLREIEVLVGGPIPRGTEPLVVERTPPPDNP